jgi:hypothetical protein
MRRKRIQRTVGLPEGDLDVIAAPQFGPWLAVSDPAVQ